MAKILTDYSRTFFNRLLWPLNPLSPLARIIKPWHLMIVLLAIILSGAFWSKISVSENLSRWPWSGYWHSQMALVYFELGNEKAAFHELSMARGDRIITEAIIRKPGIIRGEIAAWEKELETKPYSRDVLLKLALLNYSLYQDGAGKDYYEQARYLDPTNENVIKLGKIISSLP